MMALSRAARLCLGLGLLAAAPLSAQGVPSPFLMLGSDGDERLRLSTLSDSTHQRYPLLRSASVLTRLVRPANARMIGVALPELRVTRNSGLPFSLNDGAQWAGRGWSTSLTGAVVVRSGPFQVTLAPTLTTSENADFQVIPYDNYRYAPRSRWANPFHPLPESIDLPLRFGDRQIARLDPGQSGVSVDARNVTVGFSTENLWWGPGIENAIVLSNSAPGFPHAFLRTIRPAQTPVGRFEAQWILGQLTESPYFDTIATNDKRSLSGLGITWTTPFDSTLTLGLARIVMGARDNGGFPAGTAFDVLRTVGHLNVDTNTAVPDDARDQITSLFFRWAFPSVGFEAYGEWARFEEPRSLRDYFEFPGHSEGYTLGFQWAHPVQVRRTFRLQGEASYLEPDPSLRLRPTAITYTSRGVPQGFTNRGQPLGAAIGPGSSSQWLAADLFALPWRVGLYLNRIRWDNGALEEPIVPGFKRQDVTLLAGIRAGANWRGNNLLLDFGHAARFNYLFQAYALDPTGKSLRTGGIDLINNTLTLTFSAPIY